MNLKQLIGKKIQILRIKRGLTQTELAKSVGISQRTLSGIEIGENFFTAETLQNIISSLGICLEDILTVEHLKPADILIRELIKDIKNLKDEDKIRNIYKVVKVLIKD